MVRLYALLTALLVLHAQFAAAGVEDKLTVYAVNYPLQYFAQRIAGDQAEVRFPAPPDTDPAFWQPDAKTLVEFQRADLILLNGAGYAKWMSRASLPRRRLVDTSVAFRDKLIRTEDAVTHSHGFEGDHSHTGVAFTTWLDFNQALLQAGSVLAALSSKRPDLAEVFQSNFAGLERDLIDLDASMKMTAEHLSGLSLIASHPVYQYLARRYGLQLQSLMWEPDTAPNEAQWRELEMLRNQQRTQWMIWEAEPMAASVERLAESGIGSLVFDPCANRPMRWSPPPF